ncbi:MAG: hypothetical protein D6785_13450, partial [Planctomycetota bacterium]
MQIHHHKKKRNGNDWNKKFEKEGKFKINQFVSLANRKAVENSPTRLCQKIVVIVQNFLLKSPNPLLFNINNLMQYATKFI